MLLLCLQVAVSPFSTNKCFHPEVVVRYHHGQLMAGELRVRRNLPPNLKNLKLRKLRETDLNFAFFITLSKIVVKHYFSTNCYIL